MGVCRRARLRGISAAFGIAAAAVGLLLLAWDSPQPWRRAGRCFFRAAEGRRTSHAPRGRHRRSLCRAMPWEGMKAPWDAFKGSMADPEFWKEQSFLVEMTKDYRPEKIGFRALELCPNKGSILGYLSEEGKKGKERLVADYIVMGEPAEGAEKDLKYMSDNFFTNVMFRPWSPTIKRRPKFKGGLWDIKPGEVDIAVVDLRVITQLGAQTFKSALADIRKIMRLDGVVLLFCTKEDEAIASRGIGFDEMLQGQDVDLDELEEIRDLSLNVEESPGASIPKEAGFRLVSVERPEGTPVALGLLKCARQNPPALRPQAMTQVQSPRGPKRSGRAAPPLSARRTSPQRKTRKQTRS